MLLPHTSCSVNQVWWVAQSAILSATLQRPFVSSDQDISVQVAWQGRARASGHGLFKSAGNACPIFDRVRQQVAPQCRGLAGHWVSRQKQPSKLWLHQHGKQRTINSRACCSSGTHGLAAGDAPNPWGQSIAASLDEEDATDHRESRSTFFPTRRRKVACCTFNGCTRVTPSSNEHTCTLLQRGSAHKSPLQCAKGVHLCRIHSFLRVVLGAVGLLQLADFLDENVWVSAAISILFIVGAASGWMLGETQCLQAHDAVSKGVDARSERSPLLLSRLTDLHQRTSKSDAGKQ